MAVKHLVSKKHGRKFEKTQAERSTAAERSMASQLILKKPSFKISDISSKRSATPVGEEEKKKPRVGEEETKKKKKKKKKKPRVGEDEEKKNRRARSGTGLIWKAPFKRNKLKKPSSKRSAIASKGSATPVEEKQKKKRRAKSGIVSRREIRKLQKSSKPLIPRATFKRIVKQITSTVNEDPIRWRSEAHKTIQMAAEAVCNDLFEGGLRLLVHAKRVTLIKQDLELVRHFLQRRKRYRL